MKDYYSLFVQASLEMCLADDYSDKQKVRKNNRAAARILKLQKELSQMDCSQILSRLLSHSDNRVQLNAAVLCSKTNLFTEEAVKILQNISKSAADPILAFNAKMTLDEFFK